MGHRAASDLRAEYLHAPPAVGTARPRFTWLPGGEQRAYELEVSLAVGAPGWSTGRVDSRESALIEYAGTPLQSNTDYAWRVRTWLDDADDDEGRSGGGGGPGDWSSSTFGTALLDPADWSARWIKPAQQPTAVERWTLLDWIRGKRPDRPVAERLRPVQLLRQRVSVAEGLTRARLFATAHGTYQAWCNGQPADDQVLAPGFDSYRHRVCAQTYDLTPLLVPGENVLGIALADGWWAGRIGITGTSAQFGDTTAASWQLVLEYGDGSTATVVSGGDVRSAVGPWRYADLFVGECLDRRVEPTGWHTTGFDDSGWTPVAVTDESTDAIRPFTGEPIRRVLDVAAVGVTGDVEHGFVVDFGQVVAGRLRLDVPEGPAGRVVTLEHTETLAADGSWFANISGINKDQTDVYVTAGSAGGETYEPTFTFHGFRYARITGLDRAPALDEVVAVVIASDLEQTGKFHCSDARLNRLHQNVVWSQRANFLTVPTDCPQRERAGWTGDIAVFAPAATNNAQVVPFLSRWLANVRADQLPDGRVTIMSPYSPWDADSAAAAQGIGAIVASAGWSDAIATVPWVLYERTGDRRILAENLDAMLAWIAFQRRTAAAELPAALDGVVLSQQRRDRQALLYNTGTHFGDWLTPSTLEGRPLHEAIGIAPALTSELVAPMFQVHTLDIAARVAAVLDRAALADDLAARADAVRGAFAAEYVDADGRLPVQLQGMYALALAFDCVPDDLRAAAGARLAALVAERGDRLDTGFLSVADLLDALWDSGHRDLARRVLWQRELPSWLYEVDHGATTIWESWDAIAPDGTVREVSLNHYAFGCVDDWLFRRIAGIEATEPGFRAASIAPDLDCGLTAVRAHVGTPYGRLAVAWHTDGDAIVLTATVPAGVRAVLVAGRVETPLPPGESTHRIPHVRSAGSDPHP
jgi:alpha-L-rhamnosidase